MAEKLPVDRTAVSKLEDFKSEDWRLEDWRSKNFSAEALRSEDPKEEDIRSEDIEAKGPEAEDPKEETEAKDSRQEQEPLAARQETEERPSESSQPEKSQLDTANTASFGSPGLSINIEYEPIDIQRPPERRRDRSGLQPLYFLSVNYHSASLVSDLMHTLEDNQGIVIVNNSPADKAIHGLDSKQYGGGNVTVIDAPNNGGFGSGCNLGLQWIHARSPYALVWLINPDASLVPGAVASVRKGLAKATNTAILGTPVLDSQGKLWFGSGRFNPYTGSVTSHVGVRARVGFTPTRWVSGCSMILNLAAFGHCPQFDETYFLYYEDCDLCERYFQQGYKIALTPMPLVIHAVSSVTSRYIQTKFVHGTFSKLIFLRRHGTPLALALNLLYLSARAAADMLRTPLAAKGRWQGIWQFLTQPSAQTNLKVSADRQAARKNATKNRNNAARF